MTHNVESKSAAEYHDDAVAMEDNKENGNGLRAVGTHSSEIDAGYWKSPKFIGSCIAIILLANNLFWGYAVPVNVLNIINQDIGMPLQQHFTINCSHPPRTII